MRITKEALKAKNIELRNDLDFAVDTLRALTRQAVDRELLANAHNEPLVSRKFEGVAVTEVAEAALRDIDEKRKREEKG